MQRSAVNRLLVTSSGLLFPPGGFFVRALRWLVRSMVADAGRMEEQIRSSSLDWTIAPTVFLTNDSVTSYRLAAGALPEGGGSVSRVAVASFLLAEAEQLRHLRQVDSPTARACGDRGERKSSFAVRLFTAGYRNPPVVG